MSNENKYCFRCIDIGECELYKKWSEVLILWTEANRKLSDQRDTAPDEDGEILATEQKAGIAYDYEAFRNTLRQEAIERGCETILKKMG